nr:unnamed protein product [Digitaria exilis]
MTCGAEAFLCNVRSSAFKGWCTHSMNCAHRAKPADSAKGFRYLNTACALLSAMMAVAAEVVVAVAVVEHNQGSQCLHSQ